jgi:hypothetical protein
VLSTNDKITTKVINVVKKCNHVIKILTVFLRKHLVGVGHQRRDQKGWLGWESLYREERIWAGP